MQNISKAQIKEYSKLKQKKYRKEMNLFLAEGIKVCDELLKSDYTIEKVIIEKSNQNLINKYSALLSEHQILLGSLDDITRLSDTESPQDIIAYAKVRENHINYQDNFIYLEDIQDPGNLGTIIRTALWFGVENIYVSDNSVDFFSPKVIRSTMGAVFHSNIVRIHPEINLREMFNEHKLYGTALQSEKSIKDVVKSEKFGLFFGNEARGLSPEIMKYLDETFIISGSDDIESLNLSVAAGIALYHFFDKK